MDVEHLMLDELRIIASEKGFNLSMLEKDYLITYLLYLIRDVKGIFFKGGTALNKIFLDYERLSEDIDFTLTGKLKDVEKEVKNKLKGTIFGKISHGKRTDLFVRLIIHYKLFHEKGTIFIDLNEKANLELKSQKFEIPNFYSEHIPKFEVNCLHKYEMIAEKVMAACDRHKPRDYFDLYWIIKKKLPVSISLIKKKFKNNKKTFTPDLIFKKTDKVFSKWNDDLSALTKSKLSFYDTMKTLKDFFEYRK